MKIDAEKGNGVDLAKQFNVRGYPTTVFVNADGEEIDRIVGYLSKEKWLGEIRRINAGKNTYASLKEQVKSKPDDVNLLIQFAEKVEQRNRNSDQIPELWEQIRTLAETGTDEYVTAEYKLASIKAMEEQSPEPLESFIHEYPNEPQRISAYQTLVRLYRNSKMTTKEAEVFKTLADEAVQSGNASPGLLNSYAWRMSELETNLEDALAKAEKAVKMVQDQDAQTQAQVMDTQAEVLWKMGRTQQAVKVINQCIELQPEDEYYQKQKQKFLGESSEA